MTSLVDIGRRALGAMVLYALVVAVVKAGLYAAGLPDVAAELPGGAPLDKIYQMASEGMQAIQEINGTAITLSGFIGIGRLVAAAIEMGIYIMMLALAGYVMLAVWIVAHTPPQYAYLSAMAASGLTILQLAVVRYLIYQLTGK